MAGSAKKATKRSPGTAPPRVVSVAGEPIGRFARVLAETRASGMAIEPYDITEDLILYPPTEARLRTMDECSAANLLAQAVIMDLVRTQGQPPPPEEHEQRMAWPKHRQDELSEAYAQQEAAITAYNAALMGDAEVYQRVNEFFVTRPAWERRAFEKDIKEQFLKLPVDDTCQVCGQVVPSEAGESVGESSGGSSTSGPSSKETSPTDSTEPMPATGSEDSDLGDSSSPTPSLSPE